VQYETGGKKKKKSCETYTRRYGKGEKAGTELMSGHVLNTLRDVLVAGPEVSTLLIYISPFDTIVNEFHPLPFLTLDLHRIRLNDIPYALHGLRDRFPRPKPHQNL
jgi:hypothetical protein